MIDFPANPEIDEEYVHESAFRYKWDGVKWIAVGRTTPGGGGSGGGIEGREVDLGFMEFDVVASTANAIMTLAPQYYHPWMKDYNGLYAESDFTNYPLELPPTQQRGLMSSFSARPNSSLPFKEELRLDGSLVCRSVVRIVRRGGTLTTTLLSFGGSGETEATNFVWGMSFNVPASQLGQFTEFGSGTDSSATWFFPGGFDEGRVYVLEIRRDDSGNRRAWVNGARLRYVISSTGGTVEADGSFTGQSSGGQSASLTLPQSPQHDVYVAQVCAPETGTVTAQDFAADKCILTGDDLFMINRNHFADVLLESDVLFALRATDSGVEEYVNSYPVTGVTSLRLIDDVYWFVGSGGVTASSSLLNADNLTINVIQMGSFSNAHYWVDLNASGESLATNYLYRFGLTTATNLNYFAEYNSGVNLDCSWTVDALHAAEIREYRMTREAIDSLNCRIRAYERRKGGAWVLLTPVSGVGTVTSEYVEQRLPNGGTSATLSIGAGNTKYVYSVEVYSAVMDPMSS